VNDHLVPINFEVNSVIGSSETVERLPIVFNLTKVLAIEILQDFIRDFKFTEKFQLLQSWNLRNLSGTDFIEDDLKHGSVLILGEDPIKPRSMIHPDLV
jgi:hypothetical protein